MPVLGAVQFDADWLPDISVAERSRFYEYTPWRHVTKSDRGATVRLHAAELPPHHHRSAPRRSSRLLRQSDSENAGDRFDRCRRRVLRSLLRRLRDLHAQPGDVDDWPPTVAQWRAP